MQHLANTFGSKGVLAELTAAVIGRKRDLVGVASAAFDQTAVFALAAAAEESVEYFAEPAAAAFAVDIVATVLAPATAAPAVSTDSDEPPPLDF